MDAMDLGILSGMLSIRKKASSKLFKQQVSVFAKNSVSFLLTAFIENSDWDRAFGCFCEELT